MIEGTVMTPEELLKAVGAVLFYTPAGTSDAQIVGALRALLRPMYDAAHESPPA